MTSARSLLRLVGLRQPTFTERVADTATTLVDEVREALPSLDALEESTLLRTLGWVTAGLGAVALGLVVGRELRQRYKFNRRTPYDFYAHSGDEMPDVEFGVGI